MREEILDKFREQLEKHPDLKQVYDGTCEHAQDILEIDYAFIIYLGEKLYIAHKCGLDLTDAELTKYHFGKETVDEAIKAVMQKHQPYITRTRETKNIRVKELHHALIMPLLFQGECVGVFVLGRGKDKPSFTKGDLQLAQSLTEEFMIAVKEQISAQQIIQDKSAQAQQDKKHILSLQKALLPPTSPKIKSLQVATLYSAAREQAKLGGDFYDVFEIDSPDKVGILIGDVMGHGLRAASVVALVKYTIRAFAFEGSASTETIRRANNVITSQIENNELVTLLFGIYNAKQEHFTYASAGHYFPIHIPAQRPSYKPLERLCSPPIGVLIDQQEGDHYREITTSFKSNDLLVFYTDGVIEARNKAEYTDFYGLNRLRAVIKKYANETPHIILEEVQRDLNDFSGAKFQDDMALMVIKAKSKKAEPKRQKGLGFISDHITLPANSARLHDARDFIINLAKAAGFTTTDIFDIRLAIGEAIINAIEHGSRPNTIIDIIGTWNDQQQCLHMQVQDRGKELGEDTPTILPPPSVDILLEQEKEINVRGRGLTLIKKLVDSYDLQITDKGAIITLEKKLRR